MKSVRKLVEGEFGEHDISYPVLDFIDVNLIEFVRLRTETFILNTGPYNELNAACFMIVMVLSDE